MKKNIVIIGVLLLITGIFMNTSFGLVEKTANSSNSGYDLYKERIETVCKQYIDGTKGGTKTKLLIEENKLREYERINGNSISSKKISSNHVDNMNDIYNCAGLDTEKKSLKLIKEELIKQEPNIAKRIEPKIKKSITIIDHKFENIGCNEINNKESIKKIAVLQQTMYQTCKYLFYLAYLDEVNDKILGEGNGKDYSISELKEKYIEAKSVINNESQNILNIEGSVFQAYSQQENNISMHFLLELLREDYITFRDVLHKVLNPMNQTPYKISNAMKP